MENTIFANWILIKKEDGLYMGWSKSKEEPSCGEPDKLEWVAWGKELPEGVGDPAKDENGKIKTRIEKIKEKDVDIEVVIYDVYIYDNGEFIKK